MKMEWSGVIPAMTTAFNDDLSVDHEFAPKPTGNAHELAPLLGIDRCDNADA